MHRNIFRPAILHAVTLALPRFGVNWLETKVDNLRVTEKKYLILSCCMCTAAVAEYTILGYYWTGNHMSEFVWL